MLEKWCFYFVFLSGSEHLDTDVYHDEASEQTDGFLDKCQGKKPIETQVDQEHERKLYDSVPQRYQQPYPLVFACLRDGHARADITPDSDITTTESMNT